MSGKVTRTVDEGAPFSVQLLGNHAVARLEPSLPKLASQHAPALRIRVQYTMCYVQYNSQRPKSAAVHP